MKNPKKSLEDIAKTIGDEGVKNLGASFPAEPVVINNQEGVMTIDIQEAMLNAKKSALIVKNLIDLKYPKGTEVKFMYSDSQKNPSHGVILGGCGIGYYLGYLAIKVESGKVHKIYYLSIVDS